MAHGPQWKRRRHRRQWLRVVGYVALSLDLLLSFLSTDPDLLTDTALHLERVADSHMTGTTPPGSWAAPSRPPSRVKSRSSATVTPPLVDWNEGAPKNKAEEQAQLLQAIRASGVDSTGSMVDYFSQDTHRPDAHNTNYASDADIPSLRPASRGRLRPATRPESEYNMQQWSMVPLYGASDNSAPDAVLPSMRKRDVGAGAPAFLTQEEPMCDTDRLGGLVTILHSIPLARNLLLCIGDVPGSYGHSQDWWKGAEIVDSARWDTIDIAHELHRLLAFLDETDRSHGSVGALHKAIEQIIAEDASKGIESRLYDLLSQAFRTTIRPLLHEARPMTVGGALCDDDEEPTVFGYTVFEGPEAMAHTATLEEVWDRTVWHQALDATTKAWDPALQTSVLAAMGEIMAVEIRREANDVHLSIPPVWYPERYLESRKDVALRMQKLWLWSVRRLAELDDLADQKLYWRSSRGVAHELAGICRHAIDELRRQVVAVEGRARFRTLTTESDWDEAKVEAAEAADARAFLTAEERMRVRKLEGCICLHERRIAETTQLKKSELLSLRALFYNPTADFY